MDERSGIYTLHLTTHLQFWVVWEQRWDSCWSQGTGWVVQVSSMAVKEHFTEFAN